MKHSIIITTIILLVVCAPLCFAEDKVLATIGRWKISELHNGTTRVSFASIKDENDRDDLIITVRAGTTINFGSITMFIDRPVMGLHIKAELPKGELVSPLRPWLRLDGKDFDLSTVDQIRFSATGPGYNWMIRGFDRPEVKRLLNGKELKISYLAFLNHERHATFRLGRIKEVVEDLKSRAVKPVKSKKPANIAP